MDLTKIEWYMFVLSLFLIAVVFYVGLKTDAQTFFAGLANILQISTGRNPVTGQPVNYPTTAKA